MESFNPPLTPEQIERNEAMSAVAGWNDRQIAFLSFQDLWQMQLREQAHIEAGKLPPNWSVLR